MLSKIKIPFFNRFKDLREVEFRKVIFLQLAIFLIISVLLILKPLGTSLMLNSYGIGIMPLAYIGIALMAVIAHFILMFIRNYFELHKALMLNFSFHIFIVFILAIAIYLKVLNGWMTIATYIYFNLFSLITVTLFFQYCQSLLSIREAKKVLSYIGVGAIGGGVFGGYFASAMVGIYGNLSLLISAAVFLILSAYFLSKAHKIGGTDPEIESDSTAGFNGQSFRILGNRHVLYVSGIIGLGVIASKLIDYQFTAVAYSSFINEDQLTAFFGFWFSTINVIALLVQLFLVNKIIDRLGITRSMAIMPLFIMISLIIFFVYPILAIGILMRMVDGSMKQSLYKTSTEINIMPLPLNIRGRAKTLVDVVIDSVATGVAGILVYAILRESTLSIRWITIVTMGIVILWTTFIFLSKKTYLLQLSKLVYKNDKNDEELEATPSKYLSQFVKNTLPGSSNRFKTLLSLTKESNAYLKVAAIESIGEEFNADKLELLSHLRRDKSVLVRKKYFEEKLNNIEELEQLQREFDEAITENKIVITGALAKSIGFQNSLQKKYRVKYRIDQGYKILIENEDLPIIFWRTWMTAVAHSRYQKYYFKILENLNQTHDEDLKMHALFAIRKGKLSGFFNDLILCDVKDRNIKRWHKTLSIFPNKLLQHLRTITRKETRKLRRLLPALQYADRQTNLDFLFKQIEFPNRKTRITALKTIGKIKSRYPYLNYKRRGHRKRITRILNQAETLLKLIAIINENRPQHAEDAEKLKVILTAKKYLRKEIKAYVHILFILLDLVLDQDDVMRCYRGLVKGRTRATLDYLDQTLPYALKRRLLPIIELAEDESITSESLELKRIPTIRKSKIEAEFRKLHISKFDELIKII